MNQMNMPEKPVVAASNDERTWAMLCHLSGFAGYVIPFGNVIGPLVVWQMKKDEYPLVDDQGKEALNFQISICIYMLVAGIASFGLVGIPFVVAIPIFDLIMKIIAAMEANAGKAYRYPLSMRLVT